MDSKLHAYTDVKNAIHRMLESSNVIRGSSIEHSLSILEQKWASVYSKVQERKVIAHYCQGVKVVPKSMGRDMNAMLLLQAKLTEGLSLAKDFHSSVQELLTRMTKYEDKTRLLPAPSFVLESICTQLEKHKVYTVFSYKKLYLCFKFNVAILMNK